MLTNKQRPQIEHILGKPIGTKEIKIYLKHGNDEIMNLIVSHLASIFGHAIYSTVYIAINRNSKLVYEETSVIQMFLTEDIFNAKLGDLTLILHALLSMFKYPYIDVSIDNELFHKTK